MRRRSCPPASDGSKNRVLVIGAGPAGLSAAYFLKKNGYRDVLVFEKLGRVGGMCRTITEDYESFDLGANYLTPAYWETLRLACEYNMKTYGERPPMALDLTQKHPNGKKDYYIRSIWKAAREKSSFWELARAAFRYSIKRFKLRGIIDKPGFKGISKYPKLCVDFKTWLKTNDLLALERLFEIPITIMGYGYLDKISAPYALKYMSLLTFIPMMFKVFPLTTWIPWPKRFIHGYQRLWESVARDLNVRLNVNISKIERKEGKVNVTFTYIRQILNEMEETAPETFKFDHLIVATPLDGTLLSKLLDQDEREEQSFKDTETFSYCLTSLNVKFPDIPWQEQLFATVPLADFFTPWAITRQFQNSSLMQFYSRVPQADYDDPSTSDKIEEKVVGEVKNFIKKLNGTIDKEDWKTYNRWPYFQHVTPEDMGKGFYDNLEDLQGYRNTYYTGGLMNFELVEQIIAYNRHLVNKFFPRI